MVQDVDVVLASNRGPVSFVEHNGDYDVKRGAGGLSGALHPVARRLGDSAVWVAAATSDTDRKALKAGAADRLPDLLGYPVYLLDIEPAIYSKYYDVVSNRMLWFANHCLFEEVGIDEFDADEVACWEQAYEPVNRRFAAAIHEASDPASLVLFQDYHLTTAPGHLRARRRAQTMLHFTHSSFCGPAGMSHLPRSIYENVIEGMLGADLLGFHVPAWVDGFLDCCDDLGYDVDRAARIVRGDRSTWVRHYPIPIDAGSLRARAGGSKAQRWAQRFRASTDGPLIVRADRTEPSKNIVRGFEAFSLLLERRPDLRGSARFVACLYPSRESMDEYKRYTEAIQATVARINERYPGSIELFMKDDFDRTLGALATYDVLLVNPIMDGMNLVAKEGAALNARDGVLVLSRGAGSYEELGRHAVPVDEPLNVEATAAALEAAVDMTEGERKERAEELRGAATAHTPDDWIETQLEDLVALSRDGTPAT